MLQSRWTCLVTAALLFLNICIIPSKTHDVYNLCDVTGPNIVSVSAVTSQVIIRSPNFGLADYSNSQHCSVVIRSGAEPLVLSFHFQYFRLEFNAICRYDSLCVHGVKFCGDWLAGRKLVYRLPEYSDFTLDLKTDSTVTYSGFEIWLTPELASIQTLQEVSGGVGSNETSISTNTVTYYPGFSYTDRCASIEKTSFAPLLTETTTQGAQAVYHFCDNSSTNIVSIDSASLPVLINSPRNSAGLYDNNHHCSLIIRSGQEPLIVSFHYNSFYLENAHNCVYDSLCVHGVKFCGSWLMGHTFDYILPENGDLTLTFTTDRSVTHSGFQIQVSQELATDQTIDEATAGDGSQNGSVIYSSVTYYPGYPYTDKCSSITETTDYPHDGDTSSTDAPSTTDETEYAHENVAIDEIDAALVQAMASLNRARALLRQHN